MNPRVEILKTKANALNTLTQLSKEQNTAIYMIAYLIKGIGRNIVSGDNLNFNYLLLDSKLTEDLFKFKTRHETYPLTTAQTTYLLILLNKLIQENINLDFIREKLILINEHREIIGKELDKNDNLKVFDFIIENLNELAKQLDDVDPIILKKFATGKEIDYEKTVAKFKGLVREYLLKYLKGAENYRTESHLGETFVEDNSSTVKLDDIIASELAATIGDNKVKITPKIADIHISNLEQSDNQTQTIQDGEQVTAETPPNQKQTKNNNTNDKTNANSYIAAVEKVDPTPISEKKSKNQKAKSSKKKIIEITTVVGEEDQSSENLSTNTANLSQKNKRESTPAVTQNQSQLELVTEKPKPQDKETPKQSNLSTTDKVDEAKIAANVNLSSSQQLLSDHERGEQQIKNENPKRQNTFKLGGVGNKPVSSESEITHSDNSEGISSLQELKQEDYELPDNYEGYKPIPDNYLVETITDLITDSKRHDDDGSSDQSSIKSFVTVTGTASHSESSEESKNSLSDHSSSKSLVSGTETPSHSESSDECNNAVGSETEANHVASSQETNNETSNEYTALITALDDKLRKLNTENTTIWQIFTFFNPNNKSNKIAAIGVLKEYLNGTKDEKSLMLIVGILLDGELGTIIANNKIELFDKLKEMAKERKKVIRESFKKVDLETGSSIKKF